jgi:hypothetical protein
MLEITLTHGMNGREILIYRLKKVTLNSNPLINEKYRNDNLRNPVFILNKT